MYSILMEPIEMGRLMLMLQLKPAPIRRTGTPTDTNTANAQAMRRDEQQEPGAIETFCDKLLEGCCCCCTR